MDDHAFTSILKDVIRYNQLERYFISNTGSLEAAASHYELMPNVEAIRQDQADSGGLKLSHAQRRMLMILVALWQGHKADELFGEGLGSIPRIIQSMDRNNREMLGDLILAYPGWG